MNRREFLLGSGAALTAGASAQPTWQTGQVRHILLTTNDRRMLVRASFATRQAQPPMLRVGRRFIPGRPSDTRGLFFSFDAGDLAPAETHTLQLVDARKRDLCDPWTAKTFPEPGARPERFRLLVYTCAGGDERMANQRGANFLPLAIRQRLFRRALTFSPDAIVANGDHIYWDLRQTGAAPNAPKELLEATGRFVRHLPVLGTENEDVLRRVGDAQVGQLYGTLFRGIPAFFIQDDHDYFENDDADQRMVTFPPDHLMLQLGRGIRRLYFPEFLPDANRPPGLPGSSAPDTPPGASESFGTLRYGTLAEILLFDCRRFLTLAGPNGVFVPLETEEWLKARMADRTVSHVVSIPSVPPVWSAGKWGDWYPDILGPDGNLTTKVEKPYWQPGWARQHDRLMRAASGMEGRIPLFLCGDMHAHGHAVVQKTGETSLAANPVHVFLSGAMSTLQGWPSGARRTPPKTAQHVTVDVKRPAIEENGFLIVDFEPERIRVRSFLWIPSRGEDAIDNLVPGYDVELRRRA